MPERIDTLIRRMERAAAELDFEAAQRYRDRINLIRGGASPAEAERADTCGLERQRPGAMGLGTSRERVVPPAGWQPPEKPHPLTSSATRRRRKRSL
nr:UvrB/UvrC motif-containing protein [Qipengyuania sediminis]